MVRGRYYHSHIASSISLSAPTIPLASVATQPLLRIRPSTPCSERGETQRQSSDRPPERVPQATTTKGALLHNGKENGYQNQDMNRRRDHPTHDRSGDWLHHIRAHARLPKDWDKARKYNAYSHEFGSQAVNRPFDDRCLDVFMFQRHSRRKASVQCFVKIYNHDYTSLNGDPKQGDVPDPHGHTKVVSEELL